MAVRKLLKAELGRIEYRPVIADVVGWGAIINHEVFSDRLNLESVGIEIRHLKGCWGICYDESEKGHIEIHLTDRFPNKAIFLNALAHELVHVYQLQYGEPHGHGPSFWAWKKKFAANGLRLEESIAKKVR